MNFNLKHPWLVAGRIDATTALPHQRFTYRGIAEIYMKKLREMGREHRLYEEIERDGKMVRVLRGEYKK